jgi:hypothetical protein
MIKTSKALQEIGEHPNLTPFPILSALFPYTVPFLSSMPRRHFHTPVVLCH